MSPATHNNHASTALPPWRRVLVVIAHPDDESFGLGAVLSAFVDSGAQLSVHCLTRGEASTVHQIPGELSQLRRRELSEAATILGVAAVHLADHPDGALAGVGASLADEIEQAARECGAEGLVAFHRDGVTGHPDHAAATAAALRAAERRGLPVLEWTLPVTVADRLNTELGTGFTGHSADEIGIVLPVNRERQFRAIAAHASQAARASPLWRRLELLGDHEYLQLTSPAGVEHDPSDTPGYGLSTTVAADHASTVERTRTALAAQGFGVLSEIDLAAAMKAKLGVDLPPYLILGACNPPLAHGAISAEPSIGLLLPCNVVVRAVDDEHTLVEAMDPRVMVTVTGNHRLAGTAEEARSRLTAALAVLGDSTGNPDGE